ncbi:hypothetical protein [Maricaulis sp. CAU 1757]
MRVQSGQEGKTQIGPFYGLALGLLCVEALKSSAWIVMDAGVRLSPQFRSWLDAERVEFILKASAFQETVFFAGVAANFLALLWMVRRSRLAVPAYVACMVLFNIDWVVSSLNGISSQADIGYFNMAYQGVVLVLLLGLQRRGVLR